MQNLSPSAPAFGIDNFITAAAKVITPSEKKQLVSVNDSIGKFNALAEEFGPERMGAQHPLDQRIHEAENALAENPSEELAIQLHNLIVRKQQAQLSSETIARGIRRKVRVLIDSLIPVAVGIVDRAEEAFLAEADEHKKASKTQTTFSTVTADFNVRLEASKAASENKRKWVRDENAAAHFLILELGLLA